MTTTVRFGLLAAFALGALLAGCGDPGWDSQAARAPGAAISDRGTWRVSGTDLRDAHKAIDGSTSTVALASGNYANASLTIDLGKPSIFNMIVIDHGSSDGGFCRQIEVLTSMDGRQFAHRHIAPGTRRFTIVCLVAPTLARYVQLRAVEPGEPTWALGEVYLH